MSSPRSKSNCSALASKMSTSLPSASRNLWLTGSRGRGRSLRDGAEHIVDDVFDQVDQPVEVEVRLGEEVGQRLQEVEAEVLDEGGDRVVGERIADQRQLEAEQLALQDALELPEHRVQALDDDARIAQQREQARQRQLVEIEVRHAQLEAVGRDAVLEQLRRNRRTRRARCPGATSTAVEVRILTGIAACSRRWRSPIGAGLDSSP